ncbi:armadillo-type protein, partial [Endogone sp. FLAS-F59071]
FRVFSVFRLLPRTFSSDTFFSIRSKRKRINSPFCPVVGCDLKTVNMLSANHPFWPKSGENTLPANNNVIANRRAPLQTIDPLNRPPASAFKALAPMPTQNSACLSSSFHSQDVHSVFNDPQLNTVSGSYLNENFAPKHDCRLRNNCTKVNGPYHGVVRRTGSDSMLTVLNVPNGNSMWKEPISKENFDPNNANVGYRGGAQHRPVKKSLSLPITAHNISSLVNRFENLQAPSSALNNVYERPPNQPGFTGHLSISPNSINSPSCMDLDVMRPDILKVKLQESADAVTQLNWKCGQLAADLEKSRRTIVTLQSGIVAKDRELHAQLMATNRLRESHAKLTTNERELATLKARLASMKEGIAVGEESDKELRRMVPKTLSQEQADENEENEGREAKLAVGIEDLKSRLQKAIQEIDAERIRVSVRDHEIEHLRFELDGHAPFSLNMSQARSLSFNSVEKPGTTAADDGVLESARGSQSGHQALSVERRSSAESDQGFTQIKDNRGANAIENRKILDKQFVIADWPVLVHRVVQHTDQQASVSLQQKLKWGPADHREAIFSAVLAQALPLMTNRFGNFVVQRCFEFGTPQQAETLAGVICGKVLALACDPFGCHVVQKELKATIVSEFFRKIPDTIVHKYACHVWQKVFELHWNSPPAVMKYVNAAVAGQWQQVALDETGSLVVQNIFENCPEHEKRPVVAEILEHVVTIAKGQWGNWVIQHLLENGAPDDRSRVLQIIMDEAVQMCLDQFSSKVVEKALRVGGSEAVDKLIQKLLTSHPSHTRILLIDIASDQYGNYVVQYILAHASDEQREMCARQIRRHMVSLRGSKYGQKVAFMVERFARTGAIPRVLEASRHRHRLGGPY